MKLQDAVLLLINKKCQSISSKKAAAYKQSLSTLQYWLFKEKSQKEKTWKYFLNASDWRPDEL